MVHKVKKFVSMRFFATAERAIDVVWYFHGTDDVTCLSTIDPKQTFQPRLHLKIQSSNSFTKLINSEKYRFDVGQSATERERLKARRISAQYDGVLRTLQFLNEDCSQIPAEHHRMEQKAFTLTRNACALIHVKVERHHEDAYSAIDFRLGEARIQDKIFGWQADMRATGGYPYDPDQIDILQLTDVEQQQVYAIPMRLVREDKVESFFSEEALMRRSLTCSAKWKETNKHLLHDLKTMSGIQAYVDACLAARKIPKLSDASFFSKLITNNQDLFGSKKQLAERKKTKANSK